MYNLKHSRSKFHIGDLIKTSSCCGLDSDKVGKITNHFNPEDSYERSLKTNGWVPIQFEDGKKTYFPANYLIKQ
jgi:hypothetical protein